MLPSSQLALLLSQFRKVSDGILGPRLSRARLLECTYRLRAAWVLSQEDPTTQQKSCARDASYSVVRQQRREEKDQGGGGCTWNSPIGSHALGNSHAKPAEKEGWRDPLLIRLRWGDERWQLLDAAHGAVKKNALPFGLTSGGAFPSASNQSHKKRSICSPHFASYQQYCSDATPVQRSSPTSPAEEEPTARQPISVTTSQPLPIQADPPSPNFPTTHDAGAKYPASKTPSKGPALRSGVLDGPPSAASHWFQQICPPRVWPYVQLGRYDKSIGTWLLAWPCFWSIALAADPGAFPDPALMAWFAAGAIVMRGAGCTVNDMWDRDIDSKVARTRNRPLASRSISPRKAFLFLAAQSTVGLGVLLQLNDYSKVLGASSLFLVATYPLMKRVTSWPQAYLGLTFNWGALLGWSAVQGGLFLPAVAPLYAAGICWTLVYDTIYAHQDKEDDKLVGVKSTALRFGAATPQWLAAFSAATLAGLAASGAAVGLAWPFYAGLGAAGAHLGWQIATLKMDDRADCASKFVSNKWFGATVFASIVAGKVAGG